MMMKIFIVLIVVCGVMKETSTISIVPCGAGNEPCPKNFELGPLSSLRGGSTSIGLPKDVKAKGLIESVNVTSSEKPEKKVIVINASKDREDVANEIFAYHCDEGEYLFEQARKKWTDELQRVLPESCKITTDVNDTAVRKHQSVAKQLEICIQDLGKLVKVSSVTESKSVEIMAMTQQAFQCCAEKAGGATSCKIDSTSASELADAVAEPDEPKPEKGDSTYISCKQHCNTSPYFKRRAKRRHRISQREQERSELRLELRNIFGTFDSNDSNENEDDDDDDVEFVPPEETVYFAGCIQGCMGRLADAKNPKLSQIGCEDFIEPMPCRRHDQCRWNEKRKLCLGLVRRCDRYCAYVKDEVDPTEYVKVHQREDKPVAKKRWYRACVFGCNLKRDPDGKIRAKDPCHVEICEDDPHDLLVNEVFDCSVLMSISEGECDVSLGAFTQTSELQSMKISDTCPNSCDTCSSSERFAECDNE